jgi:hypothetical protein
MQAIHELRNKRQAQNLYRQIYEVTAESGQILICDHVPFDGSAKSIALYMTEKEQLRALSSADPRRITEPEDHRLRTHDDTTSSEAD